MIRLRNADVNLIKQQSHSHCISTRIFEEHNRDQTSITPITMRDIMVDEDVLRFMSAKPNAALERII